MVSPIKFLVSGHVDHGKSTILGRIIYDLNLVSEHEKSNIKNNNYASLLDILDDENHRGITIESSIIDFTYSNTRYQMIDTPGHKQYIRELISVITPGMIGCIVVSASDREFNAGFIGQGQTKEDILILRALGITSLIILVNKMDMVNYDQDRFNTIKGTMNKYIKSLRFNNISYIPTSATIGINLIHKDTVYMPWYNDYSLIDTIYTTSSIISEIPTLSCTRRFLCNVKAINIPNIISASYSFIGHIRNKEVLITIDRMKPKFISNNTSHMYDAIMCTDIDVHLCIGDIILMRKNDITLGIATVKKITS